MILFFSPPSNGVKAIQTTLLFLPAARWGKERVGGGGGTKRQMTFQTSLSVLERFEHMIHWFLVYCYIQNNKALKQSTMQ